MAGHYSFPSGGAVQATHTAMMAQFGIARWVSMCCTATIAVVWSYYRPMGALYLRHNLIVWGEFGLIGARTMQVVQWRDRTLQGFLIR
jgi:hypothetical protein